MRYRLFGSTTAKVSEVGFGGLAIGGAHGGNSYGAIEENDALDALRGAYDMGCNFFDTADVYGGGSSEELVGRALGEHRSGCLIATKGGYDPSTDPPSHNLRKDYLVAAAERSLGRLGTDYIDLYQLHNPPLSTLEAGEAYEALDELKAVGKIRWAGISVNTPEEALAAIESGRFEALQLRFNLVDRRMLPEVLPAAKRARIGVIVREPLANGLLLGQYDVGHAFEDVDIRRNIPDDLFRACLEIGDGLDPILNESTTSRAQLALKYVLAFDAVSTAIVGIKNEEQLEDDLEAGIGDPITQEEFDALERLIGSSAVGS